MFSRWELTKSLFVKGNQCVKYMYLEKYKKNEKTPLSKEKMELFSKGFLFEAEFRKNEFPGGINIKDLGEIAFLASYTSDLLKKSDSVIIYEATIIEDDVLVMCDVLTKNDDEINIYEVKFNTQINEAIIADLSVQYFVCQKRFGNKLKSFNLVLRQTDSNPKWKIIDVTAEMETNVVEVNQKIKQLKEVFINKEPDIVMEEYCNKPYTCEFIDYCKKINT